MRISEIIVAAGQGMLGEASAPVPEWFTRGKRVDSEAAGIDDYLEGDEFDWDWRLCNVPLAVIETDPAPDVLDQDRLNYQRTTKAGPVVLGIRPDRIQVYDGWHRITIARERGDRTMIAYVGMTAGHKMLGEADATHSPLPTIADEAQTTSMMDEPDYLSGRCHVFAIALHRAYGFAFLVLTDKSERYKGGIPAVHHIYAVDDKGNAYDCGGVHKTTEIISQWLHVDTGSWHRPGVVRIATERGLQKYISDDWNRPLDSYTDADVRAALVAARSKLPMIRAAGQEMLGEMDITRFGISHRPCSIRLIEDDMSQDMLRIHNSVRPIATFTKRSYAQQVGRKPHGLWWSMGQQWHSFVSDKLPKGKSVGQFNYGVKIAPTTKMVTLSDWDSILAFTISFGVTRASAGVFFWQSGDQANYDPKQDEMLSKQNRCRVPAIDWTKVAASYDAIELPNYRKNDPSRPSVEWLDVDWDVPSGCAWNLDGISLATIG